MSFKADRIDIDKVHERINREVDELNKKIGPMASIDTGVRNQLYPFINSTKHRIPSLSEKIEAIEKYLGIEYGIGNGYGYRKKPLKKGAKKSDDTNK